MKSKRGKFQNMFVEHNLGDDVAAWEWGREESGEGMR